MTSDRVGSLCTGYGGLETAALAALGPAEVMWHADTDQAASTVLTHRYPGTPNHGDITTVDWSRAEPVDLLCAGFPCQPFSTAGRQLGDKDERWLWPAVHAAIVALRPATVVIENVPNLVRMQRGGLFRQVLGDLRTAGYLVRWTLVGACVVGACHHRHRLFCLARRVDGPVPVAVRVERYDRGTRCLDDAVALLPTPRATDGTKGGPNQRGSSGDLMLPSAVQPARWGQYTLAVARWETAVGHSAPVPTEPGVKGQPRLSARFVEWMMGLPAGWVTDLCGRNDALRLAGNGVVPQQGAHALRLLLADEAEPGDLLGLLAAS